MIGIIMHYYAYIRKKKFNFVSIKRTYLVEACAFRLSKTYLRVSFQKDIWQIFPNKLFFIVKNIFNSISYCKNFITYLTIVPVIDGE